jgi:hypothetical protein
MLMTRMGNLSGTVSALARDTVGSGLRSILPDSQQSEDLKAAKRGKRKQEKEENAGGDSRIVSQSKAFNFQQRCPQY